MCHAENVIGCKRIQLKSVTFSDSNKMIWCVGWTNRTEQKEKDGEWSSDRERECERKRWVTSRKFPTCPWDVFERGSNNSIYPRLLIINIIVDRKLPAIVTLINYFMIREGKKNERRKKGHMVSRMGWKSGDFQWTSVRRTEQEERGEQNQK